MGAASGPNIVEDGLVLYLDAGNTKSYPGSGTAWTDLGGKGNNGDLDAGNMSSANYSSSDGGYFNFDGTDDYVDVSGSRTLTAATFLAWCYKNGDQADNATLIFSRSDDETGIAFRSNQVGYEWNGASNTWGWQSGLTTPNYEWFMQSVTVTSTSATAYLFRDTGTTSATNSVSHSSTDMPAINVGRDSALAGRYFDGRISVAMVYNKALTAAEVTQNYNALKRRYA